MASFMKVNKTLSWFPFPERAFLFFARHTRGLTLGVRTMVFDRDNRVLLVKHSYAPGWHFPGGGVEPGETAAEAAMRELEEESGVRAAAAPELLGLYLSRKYRQRDHVAVYLCREWEQARRPKIPNLEIVGCEFFAVDALPEDASPATRRRLAELAGAPKSPDW